MRRRRRKTMEMMKHYNSLDTLGVTYRSPRYLFACSLQLLGSALIPQPKM